MSLIRMPRALRAIICTLFHARRWIAIPDYNTGGWGDMRCPCCGRQWKR